MPSDHNIRSEWHIALISVIFGMIPYVITKAVMPLCGWDCTWYYWTLKYAGYSTYHTITEPVYYWIFGWMTWWLPPETVILVSQMVLPIVLLSGTYFMCRRLGMKPMYSFLAVLLVAFSVGTQRLWWDTLRNFTAYAIIPWFIYMFLGSNRQRIGSYGLVMLMLLSHRMAIVLIPIILAYFMTKPDRFTMKRLLLVTLSIIVVMPAFFLIVQDSWLYFNYPIKTFAKVASIPVEMIVQNIKITWEFAGPTVVLGCIFIAFSWKHLQESKDWKFMVIFFIMMLLGCVLLTRLTANRIANFMAFPAAIIVSYAMQTVWSRRDLVGKAMLGAFVAVFSVIAFSSIWNAMTVHGHTHPAELEFLETVDVPEGSIVIAPSRLYPDDYGLYRDDVEFRRVSYRFYNRTSHTVEYNETSMEALAYLGHNRFNRTVYLVDGDHWWWNQSNPLTLYRMDESGNREFISRVEYGYRRPVEM